jgi:DegV family protein with EDD domain
MAKVAVITDGTANIPDELLAQYEIHTIPLQIIWGEETFLDRVTIQPAEFYQRLPQAKVMPTTSQPTPAAFSEVYQRLLDQGYDIISIHISNKLSGTLDSAAQARQELPADRIELIDSESTAMALGFQVLTVARAAAQGATLEECASLALKAREQTGVLFVVSTLEFLHRGGRIGGAAAFLGTALNLKPILELRDGRIEAIERVRTMGKAVDRLLDLFEERVGSRRPIRISALHANAATEGQLLMKRARERFDEGAVAEAYLTEVSPVLGTHTGPGCLGLVFMAGM